MALVDLEVNPNRPDAMSVAGVARDLAARLHVPEHVALAAQLEVDLGEREAVEGRRDGVEPLACG